MTYRPPLPVGEIQMVEAAPKEKDKIVQLAALFELSCLKEASG